MLNRSHFISAVSGLATVAALFAPASASAARIEGFQSRANLAVDQPCIGNYWTGVSNTCTHSVLVQAAATVPSSGNYTTNAYAYGYSSGTKIQTWAISNTLDFMSTTGLLGHTGGTSNAPTWATFATATLSVPTGGAILYEVTLQPNQILSYLTY